MMDCPKYQYHVLTWGGFYNVEYIKIHKMEAGDYFFYTKEDRDAFINLRVTIEKKLRTGVLVIQKTEGYCCDTRTVLHRVIEFEGAQYYTKHDMGINYPFSSAKYHLSNKWYPGYNDYPLGEDFDYNEVTIVKEWITGAFENTDD